MMLARMAKTMKGGREKDKNGIHALLRHYAGALSCQALFTFVFK